MKKSSRCGEHESACPRCINTTVTNGKSSSASSRSLGNVNICHCRRSRVTSFVKPFPLIVTVRPCPAGRQRNREKVKSFSHHFASAVDVRAFLSPLVAMDELTRIYGREKSNDFHLIPVQSASSKWVFQSEIFDFEF